MRDHTKTRATITKRSVRSASRCKSDKRGAHAIIPPQSSASSSVAREIEVNKPQSLVPNTTQATENKASVKEFSKELADAAYELVQE